VDSTHSTDKDTSQRPFSALDHGLYQHFRVYGVSIEGGALLNSRAWNAAVEASWDPDSTFQPVGSCRRCGHDMRPLPTEQVGTITWYTAECVFCGGIIASPNGEILRRSSRHSEMPAGFVAGRRPANRHQS
jgi:hypothetical protein